MKYIIQIVFSSIAIFIGKNWVEPELRPEFVGHGLLILLTLIIVDLSLFVFENHARILLVLRCKILSFKGEKVRFSMSYQYRIKVNDKYLLVKNSTWGFYQHVGGKYKRLPQTQQILKDFEGTDDLKLQTTGLKKDDIAVFIPAKNAIKFIDWFNKGTDREISHWREFYEELIDGKGQLIPQKAFPYVNYDFVKSIRTPLKWSSQFKCNEILQYDILDLIPTQKQQLELEKLFNKGDSEYIKWANDELVQNLGYDCLTQKKIYEIGAHAKWVLNLKWSKD